MAEMILRQHKRCTDRWMPRERRRYITKAQCGRMTRWVARSMPGCLLSFADVAGIPAGMHVALGAALAVNGEDSRPILYGSMAAILIRLASGLSLGWEMLMPPVLLASAPMLLRGRGKWALLLFAAVSMLPTAFTATFAVTADEMLRGWASLALAVLGAPVMLRAVRVLHGGRHISSMEERLSVGFLAAMCLCGGARMLLLGVNVGCLLASGAVLCMAMVLGVGAGALTGMLSGVVLSLQGIPVTISVALSLGGFLAGVAQSIGKRWLTCCAFVMGAYLPMLLCDLTGFGCWPAAMVAALLAAFVPRGVYEQIQQFLRRFLSNDPVPGDAYAAAVLSSWEQTIEAMARAVPSPRDTGSKRNGGWWEEHLCHGCPECAQCGCLTMELGISKAEQVWAFRHAADEIWQDALENLRGMGCQRLYFLRDAMNALRKEDEAACRVNRQAEAQREMLVTHLTAMSGAARHFAMLSSGDSWWAQFVARKLRKELAERALPASLAYVRRVQGHAQAVFALHCLTGGRSQAEELCMLASAVMEVPMILAALDGSRVLLRELPLLAAEVGIASSPITGGSVCGDTACQTLLQDGRCMVALSDGMGHGETAALSSRQTVELLRLCLDAGYSREQTLTAVNGMLLLGGGGERFATADLLTIDLWNGQAELDKLGAAPSWVYQQGDLKRVSGDALPLGILEDVADCGNVLRLSPGDAIVLLSDGVEDAFDSVDVLENTIREALGCETPVEAAEVLLSAAGGDEDELRKDDQTVVVVYIRRLRNM